MDYKDFSSGDLIKVGNNYHVQHKKHFFAYATMLQSDRQECFEFAYNMTYAKIGEHRDSRSGGTLHRTAGQIFINTFQGKMAEFALYRYLQSHQIDMEKPDTKEYKKGIWDSFDLDCQNKHISVKSTKSYGQLLLLETKDWNDDGEYVPNLLSDVAKYDYTVLVRFKPDGEKIMRDQKLLYQDESNIPDNIKEILSKTIGEMEWQYDFPGFIYHGELVKMIREKCIIPKNAMLNGKTRMDAENYYFQVGNMHSIMELYTPGDVSENDERKELRLIRKCPRCGKKLVVRKKYSRFWGCKGYTDIPSCSYMEKIIDK